MTGADVLQKLNYSLDDFSDVKFSPFSKWIAINDINKVAYRVAARYKPSLITVSDSQNTVVSTAEYTLSHIPSSINSVRFDGKKIEKTDIESIYDLTTTGTPTYYYMTAYNKVSLYPVPNIIKALAVSMVEDVTEWVSATTITWNQNIVDLIVSGAATSLSGGDISFIEKAFVDLITMLEPRGSQMNGYWDGASNRGDYQ